MNIKFMAWAENRWKTSSIVLFVMEAGAALLCPTLRLTKRGLGTLHTIWGARQGRLANCPSKGKEGPSSFSLERETKGAAVRSLLNGKRGGTRFNSSEKGGKGHYSFLSRTKERVTFCPLK